MFLKHLLLVHEIHNQPYIILGRGKVGLVFLLPSLYRKNMCAHLFFIVIKLLLDELYVSHI